RFQSSVVIEPWEPCGPLRAKQCVQWNWHLPVISNHTNSSGAATRLLGASIVAAVINPSSPQLLCSTRENGGNWNCAGAPDRGCFGACSLPWGDSFSSAVIAAVTGPK